MKARAAMVGRRLSLGTWRQLEAWARWLSGADAIEDHGFRDFLRWLGVVLRRIAGSVFVAVFYGSIVQRAYGAVYLLPVVWVIGAWQMSDSSATPPPEGWYPSCRKCAGQKPVDITASETRKGMLIYSFTLPQRPNHTHIHLAEEVNSE